MSYLSAGDGLIEYNGYQLKGPRNTVQLEVYPVQDETGRYISHNLYRFSIDAWLTADPQGEYGFNGLDAVDHLTDLRGQLMTDGGALTITGFGFGDVIVNTDDTNRDVDWGPKTKLLKMKSVANGCVIILWVIEVASKTCYLGNLSGVIGRVSEYAYQVQWSIRPNGTTVRRVNGYLKIFNAKDIDDAGSDGGSLTMTADDFRDRVRVPRIPGFIRDQDQNYVLNERKDRLDFSVIDSENISDNAYPNGVARIEFDHTVNYSSALESAPGLIAGLFSGKKKKQIAAVVSALVSLGDTQSFSGTIEMAKGHNVRQAFVVAAALIAERIKIANQNGLFPVLLSHSITEHVFRRSISFAAVFGVVVFNNTFERLGLFFQITSTNDPAYQQSMGAANSIRGTKNLQHSPGSEWFPFACRNNAAPRDIKDNSSPFTGSASTASPSTTLLLPPPKYASYFAYENYVDFKTTNTTVTLAQMPLPASRTGSGGAKSGIMEIDGYDVIVGDPGIQRKQKIQQLGDGQTELWITLRGRAVRIGYKPEVPKIVTFFGQTAEIVLGQNNQSLTILGDYNDAIVYAGNWRVTYKVQFTTDAQLKSALSQGFDSIILDSDDVNGSNRKYKL